MMNQGRDNMLKGYFGIGFLSGQKPPTKIEQRYMPGAAGPGARSMQNRPLTPAEREGLVPIVGNNRRVPGRRGT